MLDAREVSVSFLVGYPKWKVRCSAAASSLSKIPRFVSSEAPKIYKKVVTAPEIVLTRVDLDLQKKANNFAPNEYRGVLNSSGLAVYKGSMQEIKVQLKVRTESKLRVYTMV